jgi:hypothetical protein
MLQTPWNPGSNTCHSSTKMECLWNSTRQWDGRPRMEQHSMFVKCKEERGTIPRIWPLDTEKKYELSCCIITPADPRMPVLTQCNLLSGKCRGAWSRGNTHRVTWSWWRLFHHVPAWTINNVLTNGTTYVEFRHCRLAETVPLRYLS